MQLLTPFSISLLLLIVVTLHSDLTLAAQDSSQISVFINPRRSHHLDKTDSSSDSTEQLSVDGHDEVRRIGSPRESWETWEGTVEVGVMSNSAVTITRAEKIESLGAFVTAVAIAIISNIFTRYAIHELQSL